MILSYSIDSKMALIVYEGPSSLPLNVSEDKSTVLGKKFVGLVRLDIYFFSSTCCSNL